MSPHRDDPVTSRVRALFATFALEGLHWCILRNHEFLAEDTPYVNTDLDILVSADEVSRFDRALRRSGFVRTRESTVSRHIGYAAFSSDVPRILAVDLHIGDPTWNDVPYLPGKLLLGRTSSTMPWISHPPHVTALLVLHSILDKKRFRPEYRCTLEKLIGIDLDMAEVCDLLSRGVGRKMAGRLVDLLADRDYDALIRSRGRLIVLLLARRPWRVPGVAACLIRSRLRRLKQRFAPPSVLAALLGPDGSGKSTVGEELTRRLTGCGISVRRFYMGRWHGHVLPLAKVAARHGASATASASPPDPAGDPVAGDPVRLPGRPYFRLARDAAYLADMFLRYLLRILPALRKPGVVLTDRYAYDLMMDPSATALPGFVLKHLYPRPDVCIYLHNRADVLQTRKSEQSLNELNRQLDAFEKIKRPFGLLPVETHDLSDTVAAVSHQIVQRYLKEL